MKKDPQCNICVFLMGPAVAKPGERDRQPAVQACVSRRLPGDGVGEHAGLGGLPSQRHAPVAKRSPNA